MFDLEKALRAWRRTLSHRKSVLPEDLDELEQHIRDHVAELVDQGVEAEDAFSRATETLGSDPRTLEAYREVYWGKVRRKGLLGTSLAAEAALIRNQIQVALRALRRHPGYTLLNVTGLAIGIACCLLIVLFVREEVSYDRFHENADRIVRVTQKLPDGREIVVTPTALGPVAGRQLPDVEAHVRIYDIGRFRKVTVRQADRSWQEGGFMFADSTVFGVFSFPALFGAVDGALSRPFTVVLTESTARKYFGDAGSAVGESIQVGSYGDFEVTAVVRDVPQNSHLRFDLMASFTSTHWANSEIWDSANFYTYLLLESPGSLARVDDGFRDLLAGMGAESGVRDGLSIGFHRLTDIHLVHDGRQRYVWIFSALALLILVTACVNYVNLSTARSARRALEVGVRKSLGADRRQVMRQFFGESGVLTAAGVVVSVGLAILFLPAFNEMSGKNLSAWDLADPAVLALLAGLLVLTTLGAGLYPAFLLSRFHPAEVLKGRPGSGSAGNLRRVLVVAQFAATVFLLVGTGAVLNQLDLIRSGDLGFDRDHTVVIPLADTEARRAVPRLRQALQDNPRVMSVAATNAIPGNQRGGYSLFLESDPEGWSEPPSISATPVDAHIVETLGLELLAGSGFSEPADPLATPDSARYQYVVTEDLARLAGWTEETAIGQRMSVSGGRRAGDVVGVIRNYNFLPLTEAMRPLALFVEPSWNVLLIRVDGADIPTTISAIRSSWNEVAAGSPFEPSFLDQEYNALYRSEQRLADVLGAASWLAILIAGLGILGLASYTAEQRTREIGIRKALGASVPGLMAMLNREVSLLVLAGFVLGAPAAWAVMQRWLQGYAFREPIGVWTLLGSGVLMLGAAWLASGWQSWRAARTSPVKALGRG